MNTSTAPGRDLRSGSGSEVAESEGPRSWGSAASSREAFASDPLGVAAAITRYWFAMAFTALSAVFFFTLSLGGLFLPRARGRAYMLDVARWWATCVLWASRCPIDVQFHGPRPTGGFLFFANHQSVLDIIALFVALRDTPFAFAAKRELFKVPFIGWYLTIAGYVEVDRNNRERAMASYQRAAGLLQEGLRICIYPEGTRSVDGSVLPFKKGPFILALESQVPIVPVAVEGAQHAVRKHTFRLYGATIHVRVGDPIPTTGLGLGQRDDLIVRTRQAILALHREAGAPPSPESPMIAPPGKRSGEREA
jgi:1-acyl-sn-glycerol-3-phosphate acyltransferase